MISKVESEPRATRRKVCKAVLVPLLLAAVFRPTAFGVRPLLSKSEALKVDSLFAPLSDARSPGFAVLVRQNGRSIFQRGYGVTDLRTFNSISAGTNFRLASFTKQFTAMAIMLLVRDGKLHYEETLRDLFPDFPDYGGTITIRHLLTHTSGLPDYEDLMEQTEKAKGPIWTANHQIQDREVLKLLEQQSHGKFRAGTSWAYSNSGYVLLGLIIAKVSAQPLDQFLHDRIFEPLHMEQTLAYVKGKNIVPRRAYGHSKEGSEFVQTDQSATSGTLGDGGVYSNLVDLAKWDHALEAHSLLSRRDMEAALTPIRLADGSEPHWPLDASDDNLEPGKPVAYGFGWFLDPYHRHPRMWHSGSTMGFRTIVDRFTNRNLTIIILCNRTDLNPTELALRLTDIFLNETSTAKKLVRANLPVF